MSKRHRVCRRTCGRLCRLDVWDDGGHGVRHGPDTLTDYFNEPATTVAFFTSDGFFRSGDLLRAHRVDGLVCYSFEGRIKDSINRGGEKIGAEEVERLIARHRT